MFQITGYLDGTPVPLHAIARSENPSIDAGEISYPLTPRTGTPVGEAIGAWLVNLAAQDGTWQAVPWRLLRNEYMRYGLIKRWKMRREQRLPPLSEGERITFVEMGGEPLPDDFLDAIRLLLDDKLIEVVTLEDEDYIIVKNALLDCIPGSLDIEVHR